MIDKINRFKKSQKKLKSGFSPPDNLWLKFNEKPFDKVDLILNAALYVFTTYIYCTVFISKYWDVTFFDCWLKKKKKKLQYDEKEL